MKGLLRREGSGLFWGCWRSQLGRRAAKRKGLQLPPVQHTLPPDDMLGVLWSLQPPRLTAVWPSFPAIMGYQEGPAADPRNLRAPISTFVPITKVEDLTLVLPLEQNLTAFFGIQPYKCFRLLLPHPDSCQGPDDSQAGLQEPPGHGPGLRRG